MIKKSLLRAGFFVPVINNNMKIYDILREDDDWENDDPNRQFVNPVTHSIPAGKVFDLYDEIGKHLRKSFNIKGFTPESREQFNKVLYKVGSIENIPINQIVASERYLSGDHLKKLQNNNDQNNNDNVVKSSEHPVLLKYDNKYMVADGNHRITSAHLQKQTEIEALVVDVKRFANHFNITI